ncbi:MAG TPA: hypothetical protein VE685_08400 [Thermoanaerobaculia bacterium]|nr:hypothetical protein [Thermoanaerobaculia bacterium]
MKDADLIVYGPDRKLQLVVEVKNGLGATPEWARDVRGLLSEYDVVPAAPFFLLAMTNSFYLWTPQTSGDAQVLPEYAIDARVALAPYIRSLKRPLEEISKPGYELLVSSWLQDLMYADLKRDDLGAELRDLVDSGLYAAIRGGSMETEVVV